MEACGQGSEVTANLDLPWGKWPKPSAVGPACSVPLDWCVLLSLPSALGDTSGETPHLSLGVPSLASPQDPTRHPVRPSLAGVCHHDASGIPPVPPGKNRVSLGGSGVVGVGWGHFPDVPPLRHQPLEKAVNP